MVDDSAVKAFLTRRRVDLLYLIVGILSIVRLSYRRSAIHITREVIIRRYFILKRDLIANTEG